MKTMNNRPHIGIGGLIFNDKKEILLGQRIASHGELMWGPPGGHLEFGESFENGIIREVWEETAVKIINPQFVCVTNDFFVNEQKHYVSILMMAKFPFDQEIKNCEPDKVKEWQWFALENLPTELFFPLKQFLSNNGYGTQIDQLSLIFQVE